MSNEKSRAYQQSELAIQFEAKDVHLVMSPVENTGTVEVWLDGNLIQENIAGVDVTNGKVTINEDRLYTLVNLPGPEAHTLVLKFPEGGVEVFAFTFG